MQTQHTDRATLTNTTPSPIKDRQRIASSVWAACLGIFVSSLPITLVATSLATIGHGLSASISDLQWVQVTFGIAMAIVIFPAGTLSDLIGQKKVYLIALGLLAFGSLIAFFAPTVQVLWSGQFIAGLGAGALLPSTLAILHAAVPDPRRRAPLIGAWSSSVSLGLLLGPFVAGIMLQNTDWHRLFLPLIPLALLIFVWAARFVPGSFVNEGHALDGFGQFTMALGIAMLIFGIIEGPDQGWGAIPVVSSFALAGCSFLTFIFIEQRHRSPLLRLELFRSPTFIVTSLVAILAMFALIGTNFILSLFFGLVQQLTPADIALRFLILNGLAVLIGPLVGSLQHRVGARWLLSLGLILMGATLLSMIEVDATTSFINMSWRLALLAIGFGLVLTPMTAAAVEAVPRPFANMASTANSAFRQIGAALGPAVLGTILSSEAVQYLPTLLATSHLPAPLCRQVLDVATKYGVNAVSGASFGLYTDQVHRTISTALTSSLHTAVAVAGITLIATSLVTLILVRAPGPIEKQM